MHQHLTPLRTRVPEISSYFAVLCACAHSDATFYEANSSRTAARSVDSRRQSPPAIAVDHRPSRTSSPIRLRPQLPPRAMFRGVPSPTHPTQWPTHSLCVPIARARQGAVRKLGGGGQRQRGRGAASRPAAGAVAQRAARVCGLRRVSLAGRGLSRPPQPGVPAWADLPPNRWALLGADAQKSDGGTQSHLEQTFPPCVCVLRVCAAACDVV